MIRSPLRGVTMDRAAVRRVLVMMLLALDTPDDAGVRILLPTLRRLLRPK